MVQQNRQEVSEFTVIIYIYCACQLLFCSCHLDLFRKGSFQKSFSQRNKRSYKIRKTKIEYQSYFFFIPNLFYFIGYSFLKLNSFTAFSLNKYVLLNCVTPKIAQCTVPALGKFLVKELK